MSHGEVRAAIEQMEAWVGNPSWEPDPEALARWNDAFQAAVAEARTEDGWLDLVARAHTVGQQVEAILPQLAQLRDAVRAELDTQERGNRALRGYGASVR
jgi:quinol monooxygenase YgiN